MLVMYVSANTVALKLYFLCYIVLCCVVLMVKLGLDSQTHLAMVRKRLCLCLLDWFASNTLSLSRQFTRNIYFFKNSRDLVKNIEVVTCSQIRLWLGLHLSVGTRGQPTDLLLV